MRLASLLKAWRHHHHMSVREAAERLGIPPSTYQRVEKGRVASGETFAHIVRWMLEPESVC
jgi:transcriptional regulator with XRE-family HTH domain